MPEIGDSLVNNVEEERMESHDFLQQDDRSLVCHPTNMSHPINMPISGDISSSGERGGNSGQSPNNTGFAATVDSFNNPFDSSLYFGSDGGVVDTTDNLRHTPTHLQQATSDPLQQPNPTTAEDVVGTPSTSSTSEPLNAGKSSARGKRKRKSSKRTRSDSGVSSVGTDGSTPSPSSAAVNTRVPTAASAPDPTTNTAGSTALTSTTAPSTSSTGGGGRRRKLVSKKLQGMSEEEIETRRLRTNKLEKERMDRQSAAMRELTSVLPDEFKDENQNMTFINTIRAATRYIALLLMCLRTGTSEHGRAFKQGKEIIKEALKSRLQTDLIDISTFKPLFEQGPNSFFPTLKPGAGLFDLGGLVLQSAMTDSPQLVNAFYAEAMAAAASMTQGNVYGQQMSRPMHPGLAHPAMTQDFQHANYPAFTGTQPQGQTATRAITWSGHPNMQQPTVNPLGMPSNVQMWQLLNQFKPPLSLSLPGFPAATAPLVSNQTVTQTPQLNPAVNYNNHNQGQQPHISEFFRTTNQLSSTNNFMSMFPRLSQAPAINGQVIPANVAQTPGISKDFVQLFNASSVHPQNNGACSPHGSRSTSTPSAGKLFQFTPPTGKAPRPASAGKGRGKRSQTSSPVTSLQSATAATNGSNANSQTAHRQAISNASLNGSPTSAYSFTPQQKAAGTSTPLRAPMSDNRASSSRLETSTSLTGLDSPVNPSTLTPIQKIALSLQNDSGFGSVLETPAAPSALHQGVTNGLLESDVVLPDEFLDYEASL